MTTQTTSKFDFAKALEDAGFEHEFYINEKPMWECKAMKIHTFTKRFGDCDKVVVRYTTEAWSDKALRRKVEVNYALYDGRHEVSRVSDYSALDSSTLTIIRNTIKKAGYEF